jgi:hypothetical protein
MMIWKEKLDQFVYWRMEQFTKESGWQALKLRMAEECKFGLMVLDTTAFGATEWPTDMAVWCMLKETFMKENGPMTKQMAMECILTIMGAGTKATGSRTNNMATELSSGLMELSTRVNTSME